MVILLLLAVPPPILAADGRSIAAAPLRGQPADPPALRLTAPPGGAQLAAGQSVPITWEWDGTIAAVNIAYSDDAGATWRPIASGLPNTGAYPWAVPPPSAAPKTVTPPRGDPAQPHTKAAAGRIPLPKATRGAVTWVVDEAADLDAYRCGGTLSVPLATDRVPAAGTAFNLVLTAWDVDHDAGPLPERNRVAINGHHLGDLTGADDAWSVSVFAVPPGVLEFPGVNLLTVDVDVLGGGWCLMLDWAALTDAGEGGSGPRAAVSRDTGVDDDGDGILDRLRLDLTVEVPMGMAGTYVLGATLRAGFTEIATATMSTGLLEGSNSLILDFPGDAILRSGCDGPYSIANLLVYNLENAATYRWQRWAWVTTGSRPDSGAVAYRCSDFGAAEQAPPTVLGTAPAGGAFGVPVGEPVTIMFSQPMDATTLTSTALAVRSANGAAVAGIWRLEADGRTAVFTPAVPFPGECLVDVTVGTAVQALNGLRLPTAHAFSFTTAAACPYLLRVSASDAPEVNAVSSEPFCIAGNPDFLLLEEIRTDWCGSFPWVLLGVRVCTHEGVSCGLPAKAFTVAEDGLPQSVAAVVCGASAPCPPGDAAGAGRGRRGDAGAVSGTGLHQILYRSGVPFGEGAVRQVTVTVRDPRQGLAAVTMAYTAPLDHSVLQVEPARLELACLPGTSPPARTLAIRTASAGPLPYSAAADVPWLHLSPASGAIAAGGEGVLLTVACAAADLPEGQHAGCIAVTAGAWQRSVEVTLAVQRILCERRLPHRLEPGETVRIWVLIDGPGDMYTGPLQVTENLPPGWTYAGIAGAALPEVCPTAGQAGELVFAWAKAPPRPFCLEYAATIPVAAAGTTALLDGWIAGDPELGASPVRIGGHASVAIGTAATRHGVDRNGDGVIQLLPELDRVLCLHRGGAYHARLGSEDGYAPGPGPALGPPHPADQNGDWVIQLVPELTRIIQFHNRQGYLPASGTEDGFSPRPRYRAPPP